MTRTRLAAGLALALLCPSMPGAERMGYPPAEFTARRDTLAQTVERGLVVMFGTTQAPAGLRFRQDNDFFYLTGNESLNAAIILETPSGRTQLFLPAQDAVDIRYNGANWLQERDGAQRHGFAAIRPITELADALARRRSVSGPALLWTRLSERDEVNFGRYDGALNLARRLANPFAQHVSEDAARVSMLRTQFPYLDVRDVTPYLDRLRLRILRRRAARSPA